MARLPYGHESTANAPRSTLAAPGGRVPAWALGWLRRAATSGLIEALWLFVTARFVLSFFALAASFIFPLAPPCKGGVAAPTLRASGWDFRLLGVWQRWDACWYERIAAEGYPPGDPAAAFFPLYPLLMRAISYPLGGNLTLGGLIISGAAYVAAMTGLYQLVRDDFDTAVARRAVLYLSVFPSAFFLIAPYTESLYLALAVWAIALARRGRWAWAAPLALLVGLTRTQGVLLVLPLAWEIARQWRQRGAGHDGAPWWRWGLRALVPLLPLGSFLGFMAYSESVTGWTTFQAQSAWARELRFPWTAIATGWRFAVHYDNAIEAMNVVLILLFGALLFAGLRRLPLAYTLYAAPQLLLIATRENLLISPLNSSSRYVLVLFPVFVLLAIAGRHRPLHQAWLYASLLFLGLLLLTFLSGEFVA